MRVLIPENSILCYGIVRLLAETHGNIDVTTAATIDDVLDDLDRHPGPDLILLQISMPGMDGFEGLQRVAAHAPAIPIIVTAASARREEVAAVIRHGARGLIPTSARLDVLRHALPLILAGEFYVPAFAVRQHDDEPPAFVSAAEPGPEAVLTPRQLEVLAMLAAGKSNKEIANELHVIDGTVKIHVKAILRKLRASNRTQAVLTALRAGYLSPALVAAEESVG